MAQSAALPKKILMVDDETLHLNEHKTFLEKQGIIVVTAPDYTSALYQFNQNVVDVVIVALELKEMSGLTLIQKFRHNENFTKTCVGTILMSKRRDRQATDDNACKEFGGVEIIAKPFKTVSILGHLTRAFGKRNMDIVVGEFKQKVLNYHREKNDFDKAVDVVKKKMPELGNRGPELLLSVYEEAGKFEEALTFANGMLTRPEFANDIKLMNTKGRILMKLKRFSEAKDCFEAAEKLNPKNMERMAEMATMYLELKDPKKSIEKYRDLMQMNPDKPDMKFEAFGKLQEYGFDAEAIEFCQETTKPEEVVRHYNNKGVIMVKSNDQKGALKSYEDALKFYPKFKENYRIHYNLALGLLKSDAPDRMARAVTELEKALALSPDYDKAKELLARIKSNKGSVAA